MKALVYSTLAAATFASCAAVDTEHAMSFCESQINEAVLRAHVEFLSSDELGGRGVGTEGDVLARNYIAAQLRAAGCEPGAADGSWLQPVPILGIKSNVTKSLKARGAKGTAAFEAPTDYTAVAGSPDATAAWDEAEVVFVGYGINAPEQKWDDFQGVDVRGKVLLVMNNDPSTDDEVFAGKTRLYYGRWSYKFEEAARRGAAGVMIIHTNESAGYPFQVIQSSHGRENFWLPFEEDKPTLAVRSWCSETAAKTLCNLGGHDLNELRARAEKGNLAPVPLGVTVNLAIQNDLREMQSANVVGVLPGTDPQVNDEYVVLTAHFDHLGIGKPRGDDAIYNGAVDNASGCAGLLALARAAALLPERRRSMLFLAVTAEESGLLGSKYYAEHPTVDKKQLIANVNVDGLNVWGPTTDIEFIGFGKNSLSDVAAKIAAARGREIKPDSQPDLGLFYRSDHFNFARIGVPAAFFKGGKQFLDQPANRKRMKASYTTVHYHQPTDELAKWWNFQGAVDDMRVLFNLLIQTANADKAPTWTPGDEFEKLR
ncbi:MAG: Zn-dependent M28 family amino/carboxypeptidase [Planctomycetota bacterium]|jgi:Zn-dependent M28 family amino/carboxypeptidase